jgi:hypothetical protein
MSAMSLCAHTCLSICGHRGGMDELTGCAGWPVNSGQCNNPLTKEPKLSVATRLLPEWNVYDREIRELQERVAAASAAGAAPTATHLGAETAAGTVPEVSKDEL